MTGPNRCIRTDEYCDGGHAHQRGKPVEGNPYEGATGALYHKRYDWLAGWGDAQLAAAKDQQAEAEADDDEDGDLLELGYDCPDCGEHWEDVWSCAVDDDCPTCGLRHIQPSSIDGEPT